MFIYNYLSVFSQFVCDTNNHMCTQIGKLVMQTLRCFSFVQIYLLFKDLRTGIEAGNTQAVLDGDLDRFIEARLKSGL